MKVDLFLGINVANIKSNIQAKKYN